ncbi:uncharacterized protein F5891DRAFT_1086619 [Suillus fuscotomentosus]|uniref:Secreted protein n=1 Tax=Suillus fuscotomentosus TaxID=1912939 RepID=A0AAD4DND9_9AGAM|nr:uncharacterized protein F5891DRAFT_1086619 [Suillus fuscotomentosus]KAG1885359.1 hypothetical protein F5891DRAFT_1086619 [Suillus fuscotomentosus]
MMRTVIQMGALRNRLLLKAAMWLAMIVPSTRRCEHDYRKRQSPTSTQNDEGQIRLHGQCLLYQPMRPFPPILRNHMKQPETRHQHHSFGNQLLMQS